MRCAGLVAVTAVLALGVSAPMPPPPPVPTPAPTVAPPAMPSPTSSATPTAGASASPTPMPTPTILMLAPDAPPQILWVALSSTAPRAGETVSVTVLTSSNVASVELRVGGYGSGMTKTDVGHFEITSQVPQLPFFMSHRLTLQVIARNTAGSAAEKDVPLQVR